MVKLKTGDAPTINSKFEIQDNKERLVLHTTHRNVSEVILSWGHRQAILHIGFLKVYKSGSSTVQNLLFRLAIRRHLTLLLPARGTVLNTHADAMSIKQGHRFDIFACHTLYFNYILKLLPRDTVRIAIIRDPLERAISAAYYYRDKFHVKYLENIPRSHFIEYLIRYPEKYDPPRYSRTKNSMARDFGLKYGTSSEINAQLERLKAEFKLVMVLEKFEESLILLKRELGWSIQDIIFLQINSNSHKNVNLTNYLRLKFRHTSFLDYAIYHSFYQILQAKIKSAGQDFMKEVAFYKSVLSKVVVFCNSDNSVLGIAESKWNHGFDILRRDCEIMKKHGQSLMHELRNRHISMQLN